jgi:hypothetical protein
MEPGDTPFAVRKTDGPCAQLQRTHRVEMRVLRPAGPDGDGRAVGRWPACYSCFRASPLNALRPYQRASGTDGPLLKTQWSAPAAL